MWIPLTVPEFAYLADAPAERANLLDDIVVAGGWLRMDALRAAGRKTFERRVQAGREEVPAGVWVGVTRAAEVLGWASSGSAIVLRNDDAQLGTLITAHAADLTAQLLVRHVELALRWGSRIDVERALADELPPVVGCRSLHAVVRDEAGREQQVLWSRGRLLREPGGSSTEVGYRTAVDAVVELVRSADVGASLDG